MGYLRQPEPQCEVHLRLCSSSSSPNQAKKALEMQSLTMVGNSGRQSCAFQTDALLSCRPGARHEDDKVRARGLPCDRVSSCLLCLAGDHFSCIARKVLTNFLWQASSLEALFLHFPLALLAAVTVASVDDAVFHARILRKTKALSAE